jgi:alpha-tubulin suppressor-like RCC1 family protein
MPTFYNYTEGGLIYSFDDVFVPADAFRDGNLWTSGQNTSGQLGNNSIVHRSTPVTTLSGGADWKQVACGNDFTAAIKTDSSLWTWGASTQSQLGLNSTFARSIPTQTFTGNDWKQVSCGRNFAAAIKTDGTLWTWGNNSYGQLGINSTATRSTPVQTSAGGTNWKQVSCGYAYTAAIKTDGTLWTWGRNDQGQLGINSAGSTTLTPVTTFAGGSDWKQLSCGTNHTGAIKTNGTLWLWGYNGFYSLGNNDLNNRCTPITTFAGGNNWKQIECGFWVTSAIKTDGTLWNWGLNNFNQMATFDATDRRTPSTTFVGGNNWKSISRNRYIAVAVKTNGTLWTWGDNSVGQLGVNDIISRTTPVTTFAGGTNWKQVSCGYGHIAAVTYIDSYQ